MRKIPFAAGEFFHVYNRGVDKRTIFTQRKDFDRFLQSMEEFNTIEPIGSLYENNFFKMKFGHRKSKTSKLVNVVCYCLNPNHYHLILEPVIDDGISEFMRRLSIGYTKYFNIKHERNGALFEGKYKRIIIKNESHFVHLPYYIHCNPLDLIAPEWRQRELGNYKKAMKFLENYRWSSHLDYLGKKNFPSVTQRDFLLDFFNGHNGYKNNIEGWLKDLDIEEINEFTLD